MNFQDDIPSIPIDNLKDHFLLVLDLTSMQDATENSHYTELVGEALRLELSFTYPLEHVTDSLFRENGSLLLQLTRLVLLENITQMDNVSPQQTMNCIPLLMDQYFGSFLFDYVPILPNENFALINTQLSNFQGEHCICFRHKL